MEMPVQQHEIDTTSNSVDMPSASPFNSMESEKHGHTDIKGKDKTTAGKRSLAKSKGPVKGKESKPVKKKMSKPTKEMKVDSIKSEKHGNTDVKEMDKTAAGKKRIAKSKSPVKGKKSKPAKKKMSKPSKGMKSKPAKKMISKPTKGKKSKVVKKAAKSKDKKDKPAKRLRK